MKKILFISTLLLLIFSCRNILYTIPNDKVVIQGSPVTFEIKHLINGELATPIIYEKRREDYVLNDFNEGLITFRLSKDTVFNVKAIKDSTIVFKVSDKVVKEVYPKLK